MTTGLVVLVVLILTWGGFTGSFTVPNLLFGTALVLLALWLTGDGEKRKGARLRPLKVASLAWLFVIELLKSGWRVLMIVLRPQMDLKPATIAYPLRVKRDFEVTILANLITLTPGTLSVDVSRDGRVLYVHCVDAGDEAAVIADIRDGFEKKIMEAFP